MWEGDRDTGAERPLAARDEGGITIHAHSFLASLPDMQDDGLEVVSSSASSSVGVLAALSPGFHGAVLRMEAATHTSDDFDFIR